MYVWYTVDIQAKCVADILLFLSFLDKETSLICITFTFIILFCCRIILGPLSRQLLKTPKKSWWPILPRYGSSTNQTPLSRIIQPRTLNQQFSFSNHFRERIRKRSCSNEWEQRLKPTGGQVFRRENETRASWSIPDPGRGLTRFASLHSGTKLILATEILYPRSLPRSSLL